MKLPRRVLSVELSDEQYQEVLFLYKHFNIKPKPKSDALRELYHAMYSLLTEQQEPSGSSRQEEEVRLLQEFECPLRCPIFYYHKPTKEWLQKIRCFNPRTKENLGTTIIEVEACKWCYDNGGTANLLALTAPKQQVSKPTPKAQQVQRLCEDCKIDISKQPSNHTLCKNCWFKKVKGAKEPGEYDKNPPMGSQAWLRQQQATRMRKNLQPKEE